MSTAQVSFRKSVGPACPGTQPFRNFWSRYRERPELGGLPLAVVRGLLGAREERFSGYLTIRTDLPAALYLEVPFVCHAWRLLTLWSETEGDGRPKLPLSYETVRAIGLESATARVHASILVAILFSSGFIDPEEPSGITPLTRTIIRDGGVGAFYKALTIGLFGRCPWSFDDGFPAFLSIQLNALFLLYLLHKGSPASNMSVTSPSMARRVTFNTDGVTPWSLAYHLGGVAEVLTFQNDTNFWVRDNRVIAAVIQSRFLERVGPMLGLTERGPGGKNSAALQEGQKYRGTPLFRRVFLWHI